VFVLIRLFVLNFVLLSILDYDVIGRTFEKLRNTWSVFELVCFVKATAVKSVIDCNII
jgi:hypothetical protein